MPMGTRQSISVKAITYQRLKNWARSQNRSMSGIVEETVHRRLDEEGVPIPEELEPRTPRKKLEDVIARHFTF